MAHLIPVRLAKQLTLKTGTALKPGLMEPVTPENGVKVKLKDRERSTTQTAMCFKAAFSKTKRTAQELIRINQASDTKVIGLTTCSMVKGRKFLKTDLPTSASLDAGKSRAKGRTRGLMGPSMTEIG